MNNNIKKIIYLSSFTFILLIMLPITKFISQQSLNDSILIISVISLSSIASIIHLYIYKKILKRAAYNNYSQKNIILAGTLVFLEIKGIPYTLTKKENKIQFSFSVNWKKCDASTEQQRAIFCSLCIHNFKGITPTKYTLSAIQNDWEENLVKDLSVKEKKKLWKSQSKSLQEKYNKNKDLVRKIHKIILKNPDSDYLNNLVKEIVQK